jgi:hypothetical protein
MILPAITLIKLCKKQRDASGCLFCPFWEKEDRKCYTQYQPWDWDVTELEKRMLQLQSLWKNRWPKANPMLSPEERFKKPRFGKGSGGKLDFDCE